MGIPWIKDGKVDFDKLKSVPVRWTQDAITLQQCIDAITDKINDTEEQKEKAYAKCRQYEEEINADTRVQELTAEVARIKDDMYRGFPISKQESASIAAWKRKHDIEQHCLNTTEKKLQAGGAIGGRYDYRFIPTSIGTIGTCICGACDRKAFLEAKGNYNKYTKLKEKYDAEFDFSDL